MPKGASAGLAAAFSARGASLNSTKFAWMSAFLTTVLGLSGFAWYLTQHLPTTGNTSDYWHFVLYRIPLAAPLVWLGWFSAVQYGNTIRVQEDYAFKEATSKAFQGYRDHMQYLSEIDAKEAGNAMTLLALRTIEILAREPLRIYKQYHHASLAHPLSEALGKFRSKSEKDE